MGLVTPVQGPEFLGGVPEVLARVPWVLGWFPELLVWLLAGLSGVWGGGLAEERTKFSR